MVLEGQVSIYRKNKEDITRIATVEKDRMFGIYCFKHSKTVRELLAKSTQNQTQILVIHRDLF